MSAFRTVLATLLIALVSSAPANARELRLEDFFKGHTTAKGSYRAINGVSRKFDVALYGQWDGRTLVLREDFRYSDGETDTKTWRFRKTGQNTYIGTREDVVGSTKVRIRGNKAFFSYLVDLDPGERRNLVRFRDTLTLSADGRRIVNTANVFKGPLPVARVRVDFKR
ncbi:MAG: DUF3833 family protein [Methyloceanibacter sp.]|jgi:hypothetical protein